MVTRRTVSSWRQEFRVQFPPAPCASEVRVCLNMSSLSPMRTSKVNSRGKTKQHDMDKDMGVARKGREGRQACGILSRLSLDLNTETV